MPRANRYYVPGHVWHITHRCHKKEFLQKFAKDRQAWLDRLHSDERDCVVKAIFFVFPPFSKSPSGLPTQSEFIPTLEGEGVLSPLTPSSVLGPPSAAAA